MSSDLNKKYKRPKKKTLATTNPETGTSRSCTEHPDVVCPLLAKDSEWVDILQADDPPSSTTQILDEEEVLQLVECEDGPQMKPLAIMFPGLLDKDPQTLQGMLNKAMSTTEVTRHLVDLKQKANFTFMKKADRLIPPEKQWLDSVTENSNSISSFISGQISLRTPHSDDAIEITKAMKLALYDKWTISLCEGSSKFEASDELSLCDLKQPKKKKKAMHLKSDINQPRGIKIQESSSQELLKASKKSENTFPGKSK